MPKSPRPTRPLRPVPPPLEFPYPPCSLCGESTEYDDGFHCASCGAQWDAHGCPEGTWMKPGAVQCPSMLRPWKDDERYPSLRDVEYRCVLDAGHLEDGRGAGVHRHPQWQDGWTDTEAE